MTLQVVAWRGLSQGEPCVQMSDSLDQLLRIWLLSIWFLDFLIIIFLMFVLIVAMKIITLK